MKKGFYTAIIIISLLLPFFGSTVYGAVKSIDDDTSNFNILCISSYNYSYTIVPEQLNGFRDGLGSLAYDIDYEFMDSKKFYKPDDLQQFYSYLNYKISRSDEYNLVVTFDDNALRFWRNYHDDLFPDTPMIFLGVNNVADAETVAEQESNATGIAEIPDYLGSFELMHKLFPNRTKVVAVVDSSVTGNGEYALFMDTSEEYPDLEYSVINSGDYSKDGLKKALQRLDEDTMIMYLDFLEDADGNLYNERSAVELLNENAPEIPKFRVSSYISGNGVLGGLIYSHYDAGYKAGEMAVDIAKGMDVSDIPLVEDSFSTAMFEQDQMDLYDITYRDLPDNSTIHNEHQTMITFYRDNPLLSNMILLVLSLLIVIIFILLYNNNRRQQLINQDFLTKMPNRLYINNKLQTVIDQKKPFGILMIDVDHFKTINDTLGHPVGDELLISVALRLKELSNRSLQIARIGGDEFMAILLDDNVENAEKVCETIQSTIKTDYSLTSGPLMITASMGCATFPDNTSDPTKVMNLADSALYDVKEAGRDGFKLYNS